MRYSLQDAAECVAKFKANYDYSVNTRKICPDCGKLSYSKIRRRKIGTITESDIQGYILYLSQEGRLDNKDRLTIKTIRDIILVLGLSLTYGYKEKAIFMLNWELIEYPKELGVHRIVSLSKEEEIIQYIYMHLNKKTAGILIALMTGLRIGELCGLQMGDVSFADNILTVSRAVQRIYDKRKGTTYINVGVPKTKSSVRTIPIPSLLGNIIKKFLTDKPNYYFLTAKSSPTEPRTYRQFLHVF